MKDLLTQFFEALDKALALDKTTSQWTHKTVGSFLERRRAWQEVWELRTKLMSVVPEHNPALEGAAQHLEKMKTGGAIDIIVQSFADEVRNFKGV